MTASDTRNPIAPERTPGGSSSGSAAAVAAGHVLVATGTQTAGSVNRPASYCGVLGYKPSFGLLPRAGVKLLSPLLDTVGLIGREIGDLRLVAGLPGAAGAAGAGSDRASVVAPAGWRSPRHRSGIRSSRTPGRRSRPSPTASTSNVCRCPAWTS